MLPVMDRFEDSWPEDEDPGCEEWICVKCEAHFIDPEKFPFGWKYVSPGVSLEAQLYWLDITEPICHGCATSLGLPPIDKE